MLYACQQAGVSQVFWSQVMMQKNTWCQVMGANQGKAKTMFILDALNLKPSSIMNNKLEQNALAHPAVIEKSITENSCIESIPLKQLF